MKRRSLSSKTPPPEFFSTDVARARRFYIDLTPPGRAPLTVVCGGVEHCTKDYVIQRETFGFYAVEYVARGRGTVKLKGRRIALQPGRLFAYGPEVPHHITGDPASPMVKYFVTFGGAKALALLEECGLRPGQASEVHPPYAIQQLFDELVDSGLEFRGGRELLCQKLLECLLLKIRSVRAPLEGEETIGFTTYQQCRQHIEQNFQRLRTLVEIAQDCHLNQAYLCRLFRRFDTQSPYQFLLRLKMNQAAEQLHQEGRLIKQVSQELGFADPFHFSRVFKKMLGVAPNEFRKLR